MRQYNDKLTVNIETYVNGKASNSIRDEIIRNL